MRQDSRVIVEGAGLKALNLFGWNLNKHGTRGALSRNVNTFKVKLTITRAEAKRLVLLIKNGTLEAGILVMLSLASTLVTKQVKKKKLGE